MFLKNCWYAAAWANEIGRDLLARTICDEPVLLFRKESGEPSAIGNMCPHRFAPLDKGKLIGDTVQCPYHGFRFGPSGQCTHNPHIGGRISKEMKVPNYPAVERYGLIWIWMGDEDLIDESTIPDFSCLSDADFTTICGTIELDANYELITDNLLDLTHAEFVHEGILSSEAITISKLQSIEAGSTVWANRWGPDGDPPPVWGQLLDLSRGGGADQRVDHWAYMRWDAPAHLLLDVGVVKPGGSRDEGVWVYGTDIITPATATSSYYLWGVSRNYDTEREDLSQMWREAIDGAFVHQDKPIIEAQQRMIGDRNIEQMRPVAIPADVAGGKARRMLDRLREANKKSPRNIARPGHKGLRQLLKDTAGTANPVAPVV